MPRGQKTDNKMIAKIMTSYALTNSYNRTAQELGISDSTVKKIIQEHQEEFGKVREQKKEEFYNKANKIVFKALDKLDKSLDADNIPINHLTTAIGTLYDKMRLEKDKSTINSTIEITMSEDVKELSQ